MVDFGGRDRSTTIGISACNQHASIEEQRSRMEVAVDGQIAGARE
jgi:hypothetical protein